MASSPAPIRFTGRRRRSATTSAIPIACCGSSLFPDLAVRLLDADAATAARVGPKAATLAQPDAATAARVGPKAATLARLQRAGLPVPDGVCLTTDAYRRQVALASVARTAQEVAGAGGPEARRLALSIRLALARAPLDPAVGAALDAAWRGVTSGAGGQLAVRSSALCEDTALASFA